MWRVAATAVFLGLSGGVAQAGELDPDHFGTWAPVGQPCNAEPRIVVNAKEVVIYIHGRVQRYGDLDESYTCYSGTSFRSKIRCVTPNWSEGAPAPFWLIFNPQEMNSLMDFELLAGEKMLLPRHNQRFQKCRPKID